MPKPSKPTAKKTRDYLKAHGHPAAKVDKAKMDTDAERVAAVLALHGVAKSEWKRAGGK